MLRQDNLNSARLSASALPSRVNAPLALPNSNTPEEATALELMHQVQQLEEMILLDGVKFPLGRKRLLDEDQLLAQVANIERCIPEAVRAAENILRRRDDFVNQANARAESIIQQANQKAVHITDEMRIRRQAEQEAQQLREQVQQELNALRQQTHAELQQLRQQTELEVSQYRQQTQQQLTQMQAVAEAECQQRKMGADKYAEQVLGNMEQHLQQVQQQFMTMHREVQNGRRYLRQQ